MADAGKLKDLNIDTLRHALQGGDAMSKNQLARQTGLSFPTVSHTVDDLVCAGELAEAGVNRSTGGRSAKLYAVNPLYKTILTMRLETGQLVWFVSDLAGSRLLEGTQNAKGRILQVLEAVAADARAAYPQTGAIAVGLDGAVHEGIVTEAFGHDGLRGVDLQGHLRACTGLPVTVENDMSAASAGYAAQQQQAVASLVCLYLGPTYPGAGVVLDGKVWHGTTGFSGELSYLPGLSLAADKAGRFDTQAVLEMYVTVIRAYAALLNPERVVLYSNPYIQDKMDELRGRCARALPGHALPQMELSRGFVADYEQGLATMARRLL